MLDHIKSLITEASIEKHRCLQTQLLTNVKEMETQLVASFEKQGMYLTAKTMQETVTEYREKLAMRKVNRVKGCIVYDYPCCFFNNLKLTIVIHRAEKTK